MITTRKPRQSDLESLALAYMDLAGLHRRIAAGIAHGSAQAKTHSSQASALDEIGMGWMCVAAGADDVDVAAA